VLVAAATDIVTAQTFTVLAYYGDAFSRFSSFIPGRDGNLYGTVVDNDYGSVLKATPAGTLTVLHKFCPQLDCTAGAYPGPLVLGTDGNFYGFAAAGGNTGTATCGSSGCGTIFKMTTGGMVTVLHTFNGSDGAFPSGLIEGRDRNFYGTAGGGAWGGTIFKITATGALTTLHTFTGPDGIGPTGIIQGTDGSFYGTTYGGGKYDPAYCTSYGGCGTVFKSTMGGAFTSLHSFRSTDGAVLYAPVAEARDGTFYGTTWEGPHGGDGTVFSITSQGKAKTIYTFTGIGATPTVGLYLASDGNLYGTVEGGDCSDSEIIYSVSRTGVVATVYGGCVIGGYTADIVQATSGKFYGSYSSEFNGGEFFSLDTGLGPFVAFVLPAGKNGETVQILGQGLTGTSGVTFNGVAATNFSVVGDTYMTAVVPSGATTGSVVVTSPSGTLTSNKQFQILP
jgi:uncharacterized repeat protein (TIGR03803 family)